MARSESAGLALELLREAVASVERLAELEEADLGFPTEHGCAMDGGIRRLLVHNAEHKPMYQSTYSSQDDVKARPS